MIYLKKLQYYAEKWSCTYKNIFIALILIRYIYIYWLTDYLLITDNIKHVSNEKTGIVYEKRETSMIWGKKNLFIDLENYAMLEDALYCNFYEKVIGIC